MLQRSTVAPYFFWWSFLSTALSYISGCFKKKKKATNLCSIIHYTKMGIQWCLEILLYFPNYFTFPIWRGYFTSCPFSSNLQHRLLRPSIFMTSLHNSMKKWKKSEINSPLCLFPNTNLPESVSRAKPTFQL